MFLSEPSNTSVFGTIYYNIRTLSTDGVLLTPGNGKYIK